MATQMQLEVILAENHIATSVLWSRDNLRVNKDETESGNCLCIRFVESIYLRLIVMSTNLKYRERERQRQRESRRQASEAQREKERQSELERELKNKADIFCWKIL